MPEGGIDPACANLANQRQTVAGGGPVPQPFHFGRSGKVRKGSLGLTAQQRQRCLGWPGIKAAKFQYPRTAQPLCHRCRNKFPAGDHRGARRPAGRVAENDMIAALCFQRYAQAQFRHQRF